MLKPLVISRQYLREKNPVGQIERVYWEYMYKQGLRPCIFCSKSKKNDVPVARVSCEIIQAPENKYVEYFVAALQKLIADDFSLLPERDYFSWAKYSAFRKVKKVVAKGDFDYIHSVCRSYSNHLIALEAKRESGLPWIASFYDPWYDNPYRNYKYNCFKERDRINEAVVAEYADAIIHTNQAIYDEWVERYGNSIREKMFVLPLVFNPQFSNNQGRAKKDKSKFVISHIGTLVKGRDSVDFLKALCMFMQAHPAFKDKIFINYVGTISEEDRHFISEHNLTDIIHYAGYLSEKECAEYFENSDLFLAIDGKDSRNIFFPSKVMKYFFYGKPILGITPNHSALQFELEQSGNFCFTNEDHDGVANFLFHALTEEEFLSRNSKEYWHKFTMEALYPQYMKIVNSILGSHNHCY